MSRRIDKSIASALALSLVAATPSAVFAKDDPPVEVKDRGAFKGVSQVAIVAFNVGFIFESVDATAATGGMIGAFGGTTKAKSELVGVTPDMMQKITDAAYADFVGRVAGLSLAVADPATVFSDPHFSKIKGVETPAEINIALEKKSKGKAVFYKPTQLPSQVLIAGDFTGSGMSSMGLQLTAGQNAYYLATYAKETGNPVVNVVYLIDFSQQKRPGAFSFGGLAVNANLSIVPDYSRVTVLGPNGKQNDLKMGQPVAVEGDFIEMSDASSGTDKTVQAAANVAGGVAAAMGMGGFTGFKFGKTRKFAFTAKPGNYEEGAIKAASLANERVVAQLQLQR